MVDVKLTGKPLDQRIADRLKNSGDAANADVVAKHGDGPTRTITNLHHSRVGQHGKADKDGGGGR